MVPDPQNPGQFRNELAYTRFWDDNKYPCQQPPWGELVAVNANTGDIAWKIPLGIYPELVAKGIPPTGTPNLGGPIATASGLVFIGATKDARFRAFDAKTGKELWYAQLEAAGAATPMTFMGKDGKQYVVIAVGRPRRHRSRRHRAVSAEARRLRAVGSSDDDGWCARNGWRARGRARAINRRARGGGNGGSHRTALEQARKVTERVCTACHGLGPEHHRGTHAAGGKRSSMR